MKQIITILLLCLCAGAYSQTDVVVYEYDAYGNRIKRSTKTITLIANKSETIMEESAVESFDLDNNLKLSIAPNPTKGELVVSNTVAKTDKETEHISYILTDLSGKVLLNQSSAGNQTALNLSAFANGVYILQLQAGNQLQEIQVIKE